MPYKKWLLILLALFLVGGIVAIFSAQKDMDKDARSMNEAEWEQTGPKATGQNVSFVITEGERKKWHLVAEEAQYFEDQSGAKLKNVKGEFFDKNGNPVLTFTAPAGRYVNKENQVQLNGGVVAQSKDEDNRVNLQAPNMAWSARNDEVVASGGVELEHQFGASQAERCRFNLDLSNISLEGNVTSEMEL